MKSLIPVKVLFLGNDASRTGAPIGLLHLMRLFKARHTFAFDILLRVGGPLLDAYRELGDVVVYADLWSELRLPQRAARRLGLKRFAGNGCQTPLETIYGARSINLLYANTVTVGGMLGDLASLRCPVICHVHELERVIAKYGSRNMRLIRRHAASYIAASEAVRANLMQRHHIPGSRITVIHESIPHESAGTGVAEAAAATRAALGIPPTAFVVGGCGGDPYRKGIDLFVDLAVAVRRHSPGQIVHFLWVGGPAAATEQAPWRALFQRPEVADRMHWVGPVSDPRPYMAALDVFALVSREDPFPFACLEAGSMGKPVLCFRGAGGTEEFVEDDAGVCVPYLDTQAMGACVSELANDPARVQKLGQRAAVKVATQYDLESAAARIAAQIHQTTAASGYARVR